MTLMLMGLVFLKFKQVDINKIINLIFAFIIFFDKQKQSC